VVVVQKYFYVIKTPNQNGGRWRQIIAIRRWSLAQGLLYFQNLCSILPLSLKANHIHYSSTGKGGNHPEADFRSGRSRISTGLPSHRFEASSSLHMVQEPETSRSKQICCKYWKKNFDIQIKLMHFWNHEEWLKNSRILRRNLAQADIVICCPFICYLTHMQLKNVLFM
jgi:hypothetical protein